MATILIVDDRAINRQLLVTLLGYGGHRLLEAGDGAIALALCARERPDLIITDIMMPNMDGYEFVRRLRADPILAAVPVVFYAATFRATEARLLGQACGVTRVLTKPAAPQEILRTVQELLDLPPSVATPDLMSRLVVDTTAHLVSLGGRLSECLDDVVAAPPASPDEDAPAHSVARQERGNQLAEGLAQLQGLSLRLAAMVELTLELPTLHEPAHLIQALCRAAHRICNTRCAVATIVEDGLIRHQASCGIDPATLGALLQPLAGLLGRVLQDRRVLHVAAGEPTLPAGLPPALRSALLVPIATAQQAYGWLYLVDKLDVTPFDETDELMAQTIAAEAAAHYENLVLYGNLARQRTQLQQEVEQRVQAQAELQRVLRMRTVMAECNHALVHAANEPELLNTMCRQISEVGAYPLVLIHLCGPEGLLAPAAQAGHAAACKVWLDLVEAGTPPAVRALQSGTSWVNTNLLDDTTTVADGGWSQAARLAGLRAVLSLPLERGERTFGALTVFENELDAFNVVQVAMFRELADDIAYGIAALRDRQRMEYLATHDALTSLPNRALLADRYAQALSHAGREGSLLAVLFIDLDNFKQVNDCYGHNLGDAVLTTITHRLELCVRADDTVARLGGDEFIILLTDVHEAQDSLPVVRKVLEAAAQVVDIDGHKFFLGASIGVATHPADGQDLDTLLKHADAALYRAKEMGGNSVQYYPTLMSARAMQSMQTGTALRQALEHQEFVLHYQPRLDLASRTVVGAEALIRWRPPGRSGLVAPGEFISVAEETGLIVPIGEWTIRAVCEQQAAWLRAGLPVVPVAVNLSAVQFQRSDALSTLRQALADFELPVRHLAVEITESTAMKYPEEAERTLAAFRTLGLHLSLDDFGTGYSSLAYLKRFPFDAVKIDRSFVRDIPDDADDMAIASAVIALAHSLNLRAVAEGVETAEQLDCLRARGCDEIQGFHFSRPLSAADFEARVLRHAGGWPADEFLSA